MCTLLGRQLGKSFQFLESLSQTLFHAMRGLAGGRGKRDDRLGIAREDSEQLIDDARGFSSAGPSHDDPETPRRNAREYIFGKAALVVVVAMQIQSTARIEYER